MPVRPRLHGDGALSLLPPHGGELGDAALDAKPLHLVHLVSHLPEQRRAEFVALVDDTLQRPADARQAAPERRRPGSDGRWVSALLRDVLAGLLLVTVGLFVKAGDVTALLTTEARVLLRGLAVYFVGSFALQVAVHARDIWLTGQEITTWTEAARTHLNLLDVDRFLTAPTRRRRQSCMNFGVLFFLLYVGFAVLCWNLQSILLAVGIASPALTPTLGPA